MFQILPKLDEQEMEEEDDDDLGGFRAQIESLLEGRDNAYDPSREIKPELPIYHEAAERVMEASSRAVEGTKAIFANAIYRDEETKRIQEICRGRGALRECEPQRIGLVGDSGVGKSSLVNCVLNHNNLAFQVHSHPSRQDFYLIITKGSSGGAVTSVVTEFHAFQPTQIQPFKVEIEMLEETHITDVLKVHLEQWYRYEMEDRSQYTAEDLEEFQLQANTACDTFKALFADRADFQRDGSFDSTKLDKFLKSARSGQDNRVLKLLRTWTTALLESISGSVEKIMLYADIVGELASKTERFMRTMEPSAGEMACPSPWPLVKVVKYANLKPTLQLY